MSGSRWFRQVRIGNEMTRTEAEHARWADTLRARRQAEGRERSLDLLGDRHPARLQARAEAAEAREQAWREAAEALAGIYAAGGHAVGCNLASCDCGLDEALALLERARGMG